MVHRLGRVSDPEAANEAGDSVAELERHASWAELFFDLVAVAGVAALAQVLVAEVGEAPGPFDTRQRVPARGCQSEDL